MKAGGDKDGIWSILESGLQYVAILSASFVYLIPFLSINAIVSHVPYVVGFMLSAIGSGSMKRAMKFGERSVLKRLEAGANKKDLFYYLVRQYTFFPTCSPHRSRVQSGEGLPETERPSFNDVAQNGLLAIIAGSDTTSSVLTAIVYYLLLNPAVYERLQGEVDSAFPSAEEPLDNVKLSQLMWLNGCMWVITQEKKVWTLIFFSCADSNEVLRLQPPIPSGSQRSVDKGKGPKVLGKL